MRKTILILSLFCLCLSVPVETEAQKRDDIETPTQRKQREERERKQREESEKKRQADLEKKRKLDAELAAQRQREAEAQRQAEAEIQRQREAEIQRQREEEANRKKILDRLVANMVYVAGGTFWMGANPGDSEASNYEKPRHQVTLSGFSIGKYEVTQEEWEFVMGSNPSDFKGKKRPVDNVSWNDCQAFIRKLNAMTGKRFRLPTEAEWEYAARGGNKSQGYLYSGSNSIDNVAWYKGNSGNTNHDVGGKQPNELGLYDMSGNVQEWCNDKGSASFVIRAVRGGGWFFNAKDCRVSCLTYCEPGDKSGGIGFRLAL